jgi:hypothetical protein
MTSPIALKDFTIHPVIEQQGAWFEVFVFFAMPASAMTSRARTRPSWNIAPQQPFREQTSPPARDGSERGLTQLRCRRGRVLRGRSSRVFC